MRPADSLDAANLAAGAPQAVQLNERLVQHGHDLQAGPQRAMNTIVCVRLPWQPRWVWEWLGSVSCQGSCDWATQSLCLPAVLQLVWYPLTAELLTCCSRVPSLHIP